MEKIGVYVKVDQAALADNLGVTRKTLGKWLDDLIADGRLIRKDHLVELKLPWVVRVKPVLRLAYSKAAKGMIWQVHQQFCLCLRLPTGVPKLHLLS